MVGMYTGAARVDVKFGWYPVQTSLIHVLSYSSVRCLPHDVKKLPYISECGCAWLTYP